jgi:hypothetical protein
MLNTTGCPAGVARDNFLVPSALLGEQEPGCTLIIPVYYILQLTFATISLLVALARTQLWRKKQLRKTSARSKLKTRKAIISAYLVVGGSWASLCINLLEMIIPLAVSELNNAMILLLGAQFFFFALITERWLTKLVRLGSRILLRKHIPDTVRLQFNSSREDLIGEREREPEDQVEKVARMDTVLKVIHRILIIVILTQLILLCVVCMIITDTRIYLQIGVGLQACFVTLMMLTMCWQYQRCVWVIIETSRKVQATSPSPSRSQTMTVVLSKFRSHQAIILGNGLIASVVYILWGLRVYEINYITIIVTSLFDALNNGGLILTFLRSSICGRGKHSADAAKALGNNHPLESVIRVSKIEAETTLAAFSSSPRVGSNLPSGSENI